MRFNTRHPFLCMRFNLLTWYMFHLHLRPSINLIRIFIHQLHYTWPQSPTTGNHLLQPPISATNIIMYLSNFLKKSPHSDHDTTTIHQFRPLNITSKSSYLNRNIPKPNYDNLQPPFPTTTYQIVKCILESTQWN